jgi:hypothetical protein
MDCPALTSKILATLDACVSVAEGKEIAIEKEALAKVRRWIDRTRRYRDWIKKDRG